MNLSPMSLLVTVVYFGLAISYPFAAGHRVVMLCILLLCMCSFFLIIKNGISAIAGSVGGCRKLKIAFCLYGLWMIVVLVFEAINLTTIIRVVQFIGCISAFYVGARYSFRSVHFSLAHIFIKITLIVSLMEWLLQGHSPYDYSFIFANPNTFGSFLLCWLIVLSLKNNRIMIDYLFEAIIFFLIIVSKSRASLISALVYVLFTVFLRRIERKNFSMRKRKKIINITFNLVSVVMISFIFVYVELLNNNIGRMLQESSLLYFNKNFFSGRHLVWGNLLLFVKDSPIIGHGLSTVPAVYLSPDVPLSGHNTFLQTAIQMGVVGVLLLLIILKNIIRTCVSNTSNHMHLNVIAFTFSIIFHESFEVCLTQNVLACGLIMWFIMGLGCNCYIRSQSP